MRRSNLWYEWPIRVDMHCNGFPCRTATGDDDDAKTKPKKWQRQNAKTKNKYKFSLK